MAETTLPKSSTHQELVLDSLFRNHRGLGNLIIIQDSPSQSGLPILLQLLHQAAIKSSDDQRQENVVLIKTTSDLLLQHFGEIKSKLETGNHAASFQSIDLSRLVQHNSYHDEKTPQEHNSEFGLSNLLQIVRQHMSCSDNAPITSIRNSEKPLSILIDTIQELFRLYSIHETILFLKDLLNLLTNPESRLIILDSPHLHLKSSNDCLEEIVEPSIGLRSLALSTSHLHLRIHPTSLIDHLINDFGLPAPFQSTKQPGTHYDLRLFQLIDELALNCNPYLAGKSTADEHEFTSIPQALLIAPNSSSSSATDNLGTCVIQWTAKNIQSLSCSPLRPSTSIKPSSSKKNTKSHKVKPSANLSSVQHGLEALQLSLDPSSSFGFQLTPVPISKVIKKRSFKLSEPVGDQTRSNSALDPLHSQLTFNLSLTEKQRADREAVELPFLPKRSKDGSVIEAPGEIYDGSFQKKESQYGHDKRMGGRILYEPDSADDFDDEEPEDD